VLKKEEEVVKVVACVNVEREEESRGWKGL
jgi:hypothetical protein